MLRTGVDIIEIGRVQSIIERHGRRFLERVYTPAELEETRANLPSLAARFAAKEAVAKALGCGIGKVGWLDIEVRRGASGEPTLHLHGKAHTRAEALHLTEWSLSLSHSRQYAVAFVVAGSPPPC